MHSADATVRKCFRMLRERTFHLSFETEIAGLSTIIETIRVDRCSLNVSPYVNE